MGGGHPDRLPSFFAGHPVICPGMIPHMEVTAGGAKAPLDLIEQGPLVLGCLPVAGDKAAVKFPQSRLQKQPADPFLPQIHVAGDHQGFPHTPQCRQHREKQRVGIAELPLRLPFRPQALLSVQPRPRSQNFPDFLQRHLPAAAPAKILLTGFLLRPDPQRSEIGAGKLLPHKIKEIPGIFHRTQKKGVEGVEGNHVAGRQFPDPFPLGGVLCASGFPQYKMCGILLGRSAQMSGQEGNPQGQKKRQPFGQSRPAGIFTAEVLPQTGDFRVLPGQPLIKFLSDVQIHTGFLP